MGLIGGLVAVGDSVSEGVGDPAPGHVLHGWPHYLACGCDGLWLQENLARAGATVSVVRRRQLDRAVGLDPAILSCTVGVNDVFSHRFDPERFERDYDHVIGALATAARVGVLTMFLHDFTAGLPLRRNRAELRRRTAQANDVIDRVSARHGAWPVDGRAAAPMHGAGMLSIDRLHPNRRGHRYIAAFALDVLRAQGVVPPGPAAAIPARDPWPERTVSAARHAHWLGRYAVLPFVRRRLTRR